tara:strand:+ start:489 stop:1283 length:795 start_codon:yes stop_codon:yes gene_type:complete
MASLTENYNELQFTPKSWEFVSSMENFPFDNLPQEGSGSRGIWTMKDVKEILPKPEKKNSLGIFASKAAKELFEENNLSPEVLKDPSGKNGFTIKDVKASLPKKEKKNSLGIFASKAAKELFEKSGLSKDILKDPSGTKGGYTTKDIKKLLPKPEKKNSLGIFASKAAKELFEKSNLKKESLKSPSGTKGGFTTKDIKKLLPKEEKKKKFFASKVAKELFEKSGDLENIETILKKNKSTNKKGLYTKAEVEKAILINTIKKEQD